jgi:hypothetical protein
MITAQIYESLTAVMLIVCEVPMFVECGIVCVVYNDGTYIVILACTSKGTDIIFFIVTRSSVPEIHGRSQICI